MTAEKKEQLIKYWIAFGDIPITNNDEIMLPFIGYPVGTDRFEIWLWFDEQYEGGVVQLMHDAEEVMFNERVS